MRYAVAACCAALLPLMAMSGELQGENLWRQCQQDADCVLIDGLCNKTSVNRAFESDARVYYKEQAEGATCPQRFWEPKSPVAQCRLGSCSTAAQSAKK